MMAPKVYNKTRESPNGSKKRKPTYYVVSLTLPKVYSVPLPPDQRGRSLRTILRYLCLVYVCVFFFFALVVVLFS